MRGTGELELLVTEGMALSSQQKEFANEQWEISVYCRALPLSQTRMQV
jgi:hypothetical protein